MMMMMMMIIMGHTHRLEHFEFWDGSCQVMFCQIWSGRYGSVLVIMSWVRSVRSGRFWSGQVGSGRVRSNAGGLEPGAGAVTVMGIGLKVQ